MTLSLLSSTNMAMDYGKQFIKQNVATNYGGMLELEKYTPLGDGEMQLKLIIVQLSITCVIPQVDWTTTKSVYLRPGEPCCLM